MSDFLNIVAWNGVDKLDYWYEPGKKYCYIINGTDGSQYPPTLTRDRVLHIYTSKLCRWVWVVRVGVLGGWEGEVGTMCEGRGGRDSKKLKSDSPARQV